MSLRPSMFNGEIISNREPRERLQWEKFTARLRMTFSRGAKRRKLASHEVAGNVPANFFRPDGTMGFQNKKSAMVETLCRPISPPFEDVVKSAQAAVLVLVY